MMLDDTLQECPADRCVQDLITERALRWPDAVAVCHGQHVVSYGRLHREACQLARYLQSIGVKPGVLVGVCLERSPDFIVGALAVLQAGGAYVPLDPAYPAARLSFMVRDAQLPVVITRAPLIGSLPNGGHRLVDLDADAEAIAAAPETKPSVAPAKTDLAYVIYTSGSTGTPKGVQVAHESLLNLVFWHRRTFALTAADRATHLAGLGFDASVWEIWPYLAAGASIYLPDEETRKSAVKLRDWIVAKRITISFMPTALAEQAMALTWPAGTALRYLLTGADTLHRYPSPDLPFALVNNYGLTETTVVATSGIVPVGSFPTKPTIGRAIDNTTIYILDDLMRPCDVGEAGEIYVGGVSLARGYLNRPDLTLERFIAHPFDDDPEARLYRTGDRGYLLEDGQVCFLGRSDSQVKIRGYRIEPQEIVQALRTHPAVAAAAVVARDDLGADRRLVGYLVPEEGQSVASEDLRTLLAEQLPDYMIPSAFVWITAMPLTANGKVDTAALPIPDQAREEAYVPPRTQMEQQLAEIIATLLGVDRVGVHDNFFLLGGHSLMGTQLIGQIGQRFGVTLSLFSLFSGPTVAEIATHVEQLILKRLETLTDEEVALLLSHQAVQQ